MRAMRVLLVGAVIGTTTMAGAAPARADIQACAGTVRITTPHLYNPPLGPDGSGRWSMELIDGTCTGAADLVAGGTLAGNCLLGSGSGTVNGHDITVTWLGGTMFWSGDAIGYWPAVALVNEGHSCNAGSAAWTAVGSMVTTA